MPDNYEPSKTSRWPDVTTVVLIVLLLVGIPLSAIGHLLVDMGVLK